MKKTMILFFTLIELLLVIAIISILMSILLPALKKARDYGKKIVCANNMKQMSLAANYYVGDYDGYLPIGRRYYWVGHLNSYIKIKTDGIINGGGVWNEGSNNIFICPSTLNPGNSPYFSGTYNHEKWTTSYGTTQVYETFAEITAAGNPARWGGWSYAHEGGYKKLSQVTDKSVLLIETRYYMINWNTAISNYYNRYYRTDENNAGSPAWRHPGLSANFLIKDGSVQNYHYTGIYVCDFEWIPIQ